MRVLLCSTLMMTATLAGASSDESWDAFRAEVAAKCEAEVRTDTKVTDVVLTVDPFGSESFGIAIAEITASWGTARRVCIFDKATGRVELSGEF